MCQKMQRISIPFPFHSQLIPIQWLKRTQMVEMNEKASIFWHVPCYWNNTQNWFSLSNLVCWHTVCSKSLHSKIVNEAHVFHQLKTFLNAFMVTNNIPVRQTATKWLKPKKSAIIVFGLAQNALAYNYIKVIMAAQFIPTSACKQFELMLKISRSAISCVVPCLLIKS